MTLDEYRALREEAIKLFGKDYVKGVDLATEILVAAGEKQWRLMASHVVLLDPENDQMMAGYNDRMVAIRDDHRFTNDDIDQILGYIDANMRKGIQ